MSKGMTAAVADMKDDARESERQFDMEFGYNDENPIDRHVRLFLTPRKATPSMFEAIRQQAQLEAQEVLIQPKEGVDDEEKAFRPGLIQFHRSHSGTSRKGIPSFGRDGESTNSSDDSTPFGYGTGVDTPGSAWSEASFEAIKPEDMYSLYGVTKAVKASMAMATTLPLALTPMTSLTETISTSASIMERSSYFSTCSSWSASTSSTDSTARPPRPALGRPRPRANPYPGSFEKRAKEREADAATHGGRVANYFEQEEEEWLNGRTVSERMIAQAGFTCQTGRAALRR